jgi:uncharacterized membrane protein YfcA
VHVILEADRIGRCLFRAGSHQCSRCTDQRAALAQGVLRGHTLGVSGTLLPTKAHLTTHQVTSSPTVRCGHSVGLIIVAAIFLGLKGQLDLEVVGSYLDWVVGVLMIALGIYTMYMAVGKPEAASASTKAVGGASPTRPLPVASPPAAGEPCGEGPHEDDPPKGDIELVRLASGPRSTSHFGDEEAQEKRKDPSAESTDPCKKWKERGIAFVVGIVHGAAGPGGVLGVLPAVQMRSWSKAGLYLGTFCITSIFVMGLLASSYGELTRWAGRDSDKVAFGLKVFSASLSLIVGIVWIALSATGHLEEVFG